MAKVLGIDLGTTNSVMAVMEGGEPTILENAEGNRLTPSVVAVNPKTGERLVGQVARRQAITNPENTIFSVKRFMGRKFDDPRSRRRSSSSRTRSRRASNGDVRVVDGRQGVLAARGLGDDPAEAEGGRRGEPGRDGHPGGHHRPGLLQRQPAPGDQGRRPDRRPRSAAHHQRADRRLAGLRPRQEGHDETIAVYDLGGGTFDISILRVGEGVFEVMATNGDTYLGGDDFDQRIIDWVGRRVPQGPGHRPAPGPDGAPAAEGGGREGQDRALDRPSRPRSTCRSSPPTPPARST